MKSEIIEDQILINNSIKKYKKSYNICKSTIKIELKNGSKASGFFIKYKREKKPFYCIMTNHHVIPPELTDNGESILIKYDGEEKNLKLVLNQKERHIQCLRDLLGIDITIIEIIEKDNIDDSFFSLPMEYDCEYQSFKGKNILVSQYPLGGEIHLSDGQIIEIKDFIFYHDADTLHGSSGGPIILQGDDKILGIHKGSKNNSINVGIFIKIILEIVMQLKRNGEGIEYYKNGKIKYIGNFVDDEYDGEGQFHYENGEIYIGGFKHGKRNGSGCVFKDEDLIQEGEFINDEYIEPKEIEEKGKILKKIGLNIGKLIIFPYVGYYYAWSGLLGFKCTKCWHSKKDHVKIGEKKNKCYLCKKICES